DPADAAQARGVVVLEEAEQVRHVRHRPATIRTDRLERPTDRIEICVEDASCRAGLDNHEAERVSRDVVQLTGDPRALHLDRKPLALLAFVSERERPILELSVQAAP